MSQAPGLPLLDPPFEDDVLDSLKSVGDWYTIGLRLEMPTLVLDEIKTNKEIREQKREMIRKWLRDTNGPSWRHILGILDGLGLTRPAQDIRNRYAPSGKRPLPKIQMPRLSDKPTLKELGSLTKDAELKVQVMEKVSPHWDSLAIQLGFEFPRIEQIRSDNRTTLNCCQDMFSMWLTEGFRRPVTWKTLLDALGDSEYQVMADTLRKLLRD